MLCPFCQAEATDVVNTRPTRHQTQIWRRRQCSNCREIFTTYERADLSFLKVVKKSGRKERYSRAKLFSGIYGAFLSIPNKEKIVDEVADAVEAKLLGLKKKELSSSEISKVVLGGLKSAHTAAFMRFLAYNANISSETQLKKELAKY